MRIKPGAIAFLLLLNTALSAQNSSSPIVNENKYFEEQNGLLFVEAEFFYKQSKSAIRSWYRTSENELPKIEKDNDEPHFENASNKSYVEILPDTRITHDDVLTTGENFSNLPGEMGLLHYQIKINNPGRYYVWVRAFSTGTEDNGIHVGMDGFWPETGQRLQWCDGKNSWTWESKQRTEKVHCGEPYLIFLDIENAGPHEITFSMREDGFEFDCFLLTKDKNFKPEGIGFTKN